MKNYKDNVDDAEEVVRLLSFPGCILNGKLTPEAFSLYHKDEDYVSVLRSLFVSSETEMIALGRKIKRWPVKNACFCGYCRLDVAKIRLLSKFIDVISCYEEHFKAHAGIVYFDTDGTRVANTQKAIFPPHLHLLQLKLCYIARDLTLIR